MLTMTVSNPAKPKSYPRRSTNPHPTLASVAPHDPGDLTIPT